MSEAFLVAAASLAGSAGETIQALLRKAGLPARRAAARQMAEIHWLLPDGDDGAWLPPTLHELGFAPGLAVFGWPSAPLLDHYLLHSAARTVQAGQRELIIVGQSAGSQPAAVLLAAAAAVGRYNLAPQARLAAMLSLNSIPDGLVSAASAAIQRLAERERAAYKPAPQNQAAPSSIQPPAQPQGMGQPFMNVLPEMLPSGDLRSTLPGYKQPEEVESEPDRFDLPLCKNITWLAASTAITTDLSPYFPRAKWLADSLPGGALARLGALAMALEQRGSVNQPQTWGALLSSGPLENGLLTLLERT